MDFFVLVLNKELPPARVASLLGRLFAIEATAVAELLSGASSELYYEITLLKRAKVPRSDNPEAVFFVELCVYPHGHLATVYENNQAFAGAFARESQLPVLLYAGHYRCLLLEEVTMYEVDEWPEDEETIAITVTPENKKQVPLG